MDAFSFPRTYKTHYNCGPPFHSHAPPASSVSTTPSTITANATAGQAPPSSMSASARANTTGGPMLAPWARRPSNDEAATADQRPTSSARASSFFSFGNDWNHALGQIDSSPDVTPPSENSSAASGGFPTSMRLSSSNNSAPAIESSPASSYTPDIGPSGRLTTLNPSSQPFVMSAPNTFAPSGLLSERLQMYRTTPWCCPPAANGMFTNLERRGAIGPSTVRSELDQQHPSSSPPGSSNLMQTTRHSGPRRHGSTSSRGPGGSNGWHEHGTARRGQHWSLPQMWGHLEEYCRDQEGSRVIQDGFQLGSLEVRDRVFREILPHALDLMADPFGNYVMQLVFQHGAIDHRCRLARTMQGNIVRLTMDRYACRVVQAALALLSERQQIVVAYELQPVVMACAQDQNGNHVIQKFIMDCTTQASWHIIEPMRGNLVWLATHTFGCRIVQRCLEHGAPEVRRMVINELNDRLTDMIAHEFGNYVVQFVVVHDIDGIARGQIMKAVLHGLIGFCKDKCASNVVEECIKHGSEGFRVDVMLTLANRERAFGAGYGPLMEMVDHQYGNYVIQTLLEHLPEHACVWFAQLLGPILQSCTRQGTGRYVTQIQNKMQLVERSRSARSSTVQQQTRQQPLASPPQHQVQSPAQSFPSSQSSIPQLRAMASPPTQSRQSLAAMPLQDNGHPLGLRQNLRQGSVVYPPPPGLTSTPPGLNSVPQGPRGWHTARAQERSFSSLGSSPWSTRQQ